MINRLKSSLPRVNIHKADPEHVIRNIDWFTDNVSQLNVNTPWARRTKISEKINIYLSILQELKSLIGKNNESEFVERLSELRNKYDSEVDFDLIFNMLLAKSEDQNKLLKQMHMSAFLYTPKKTTRLEFEKERLINIRRFVSEIIPLLFDFEKKRSKRSIADNSVDMRNLIFDLIKPYLKKYNEFIDDAFIEKILENADDVDELIDRLENFDDNLREFGIYVNKSSSRSKNTSLVYDGELIFLNKLINKYRFHPEFYALDFIFNGLKRVLSLKRNASRSDLFRINELSDFIRKMLSELGINKSLIKRKDLNLIANLRYAISLAKSNEVIKIKLLELLPNVEQLLAYFRLPSSKFSLPKKPKSQMTNQELGKLLLLTSKGHKKALEFIVEEFTTDVSIMCGFGQDKLYAVREGLFLAARNFNLEFSKTYFNLTEYERSRLKRDKKKSFLGIAKKLAKSAVNVENKGVSILEKNAIRLDRGWYNLISSPESAHLNPAPQKKPWDNVSIVSREQAEYDKLRHYVDAVKTGRRKFDLGIILNNEYLTLEQKAYELLRVMSTPNWIERFRVGNDSKIRIFETIYKSGLLLKNIRYLADKLPLYSLFVHQGLTIDVYSERSVKLFYNVVSVYNLNTNREDFQNQFNNYWMSKRYLEFYQRYQRVPSYEDYTLEINDWIKSRVNKN